jgi:hypothetical protein
MFWAQWMKNSGESAGRHTPSLARRPRSQIASGDWGLRAAAHNERRGLSAQRPRRSFRLRSRRASGRRMCQAYGATSAAWLLITSKVFLASSWVALTCPYQALPPAFDWLAV